MDNSGSIRLVVFVGALLILVLAEIMAPRRPRNHSRLLRWRRNLGIVAAANLLVVMLNAAVARFAAPIAAGAVALWVEGSGIGLLQMIAVPGWLAVTIAVVLLDLLIYGQHVLFHWHPWLWRLHKVHHIDQELDVTSGIRFHPVEIVLSVFIKSAAVVILGVPFVAVVIFEVTLNAAAMFNHSNIRLPIGLDRLLRRLIVTPDMHRVHHSVLPRETHSNFGFNLAIWDRLFGTYRAQPRDGHLEMRLGLPDFQDASTTGFWRMLRLPLEKPGDNGAREQHSKAPIDDEI